MADVIEALQSRTDALAADTERRVLAVYADLVAGRIDQQTAVAYIAAAVNRANAAAVSLADVWLALQIETATATPTPTVGVAPIDESERLALAATTVLSEPGDTLMQLARLARSEPLNASQRGAVDAMVGQRSVEGWTRQMDGDPCQLCRWWWREGRVWPKAHPFQRHPGCNCQPRAIVTTSIKGTGYTRRLERHAAP